MKTDILMNCQLVQYARHERLLKKYADQINVSSCPNPKSFRQIIQQKAYKIYIKEVKFPVFCTYKSSLYTVMS